jgi:hypothetical protein
MIIGRQPRSFRGQPQDASQKIGATVICIRDYFHGDERPDDTVTRRGLTGGITLDERNASRRSRIGSVSRRALSPR